MLIFFAPERIEDERVQSLKMKALFTAMSAMSGVLVLVHLQYLDFIAADASPRSFRGVSASEMFAGLMLTAAGSFHYWRWQDGRTQASPD